MNGPHSFRSHFTLPMRMTLKWPSQNGKKAVSMGRWSERGDIENTRKSTLYPIVRHYLNISVTAVYGESNIFNLTYKHRRLQFLLLEIIKFLTDDLNIIEQFFLNFLSPSVMYIYKQFIAYWVTHLETWLLIDTRPHDILGVRT